MWERGRFANMVTKNYTSLIDPWASTIDHNAPFDQEFFLILNVAVGGTNGFWPDLVGDKPWNNASPTAPLEFWKASPLWLRTWGEGDTKGMTVKSVKVYKPCL